jgi:ABC-type multidrug transport system ATPase subunit
VRDLKSTNGTFINDQRIETETWLESGDTIRIGPHRFEVSQDGLTGYDETKGLRLEALGLNKWVRKDLNLLKDLYLLFKPREFVVIVGQSGGGKSTLVDAIAGYRPATNGQVLVNNIDIYRYFDSIRNEIGFVPQRDIIHMELTVYQALDYAARLRMPADITKEERHQRIMEVLTDLDLAHRKDVQISGLSGGQQKRVSIGVELLTKPGLFFLDEPSSGLDPGTETALMHLMRRLADQGRTIILITHATKNVMLSDKVVFLARGGYLAWFGPPDAALKYFDQFRSERDRRARSTEFDEIYAVLDDPSNGTAEEWARRFAESPHYQEFVVKPLSSLGHAVPGVGASSSMAASMPKEAGIKPPENLRGVVSRATAVHHIIFAKKNTHVTASACVMLFVLTGWHADVCCHSSWVMIYSPPPTAACRISPSLFFSQPSSQSWLGRFRR